MIWTAVHSRVAWAIYLAYQHLEFNPKVPIPSWWENEGIRNSYWHMADAAIRARRNKPNSRARKSLRFFRTVKSWRRAINSNSFVVARPVQYGSPWDHFYPVVTELEGASWAIRRLEAAI